MNAIVPSRVLHGEILGEDDIVSIVVATNPYSSLTRKEWAPAGQTITELMQFCGLDMGGRYVVHIEGDTIKQEVWHRVRAKPGTSIQIQAVPGELISGISALIGAISAAATAASAFISGLGIFGSILTTALSIGFNLLLGALFGPPKQKQLDQKEPARGYSVGASRNSVDQFGAIPVVLGRHRFSPPYAAKPYTVTEGLDTIVHMALAVGYGPLVYDDLRVGETPLSSFVNTTLETYAGYADDADISFFGQQIIEETLSVDLKQSEPFNVRRTSDDVTYISLDFYWPQGLYFAQKDGDIKALHHRVAVEISEANANNYSGFLGFTFSGDRTRDARRHTVGGAVPKGQYDIRVRLAEESGGGDDTVYVFQNDLKWVAMRGYRPGRAITFRKPLAKIGIRMKASGQLNGTLDTFNLVASSIFKNVFGNTVTSSNPADLLRLVLQGPANNRPIADTQFDFATMQRWHTYCVNEKWTYDNVITDRRSVYDMALEVCAAGRAVPLFRDGLWSIVWDEPSAAIAQVFTPRNSWGFEGKKEFVERPHAWRIRFVNAKRDWIDDERIVYDDGYSAANATLFQMLQLPGVTDPDLIWRQGRYHIAQLRLRPETYILNVAWENMLLTKGDRVRVAHDTFLVGVVQGRVTGVDAATRTVRLDESIEVDQGVPYSIRFRSKETVLTQHPVTFNPTDTNVVRLDGIGPMPEVGELFTFGQTDRDSAIFRVLQIERQDEMTATLTLVDDAPGIALADNGAIPAFVSNITAPVDPYKLTPTGVLYTVRAYLDQDRLRAAVRLDWVVPRQGAIVRFEVETRNAGVGNAVWLTSAPVLAPATSNEITDLDSGVYQFRVRSIFDDGTFSGWVETEVVSTKDALRLPPAVEGFRITTNGDVSTLTWDASPDPTVQFYEVRFSAAGDEWNAAVPLVEQAMPGVQVATMVGTYFVKAGRRNGARSAVAAQIRSSVASLTGFNAVEVIDEAATGFTGQKSKVVLSNGRLRLAPRAVMSSWSSLSSVINLRIGEGGSDTIGLAVEGVYTFAGLIDLGEVFTSRVSANIKASGTNIGMVMSSWIRLSDVKKLSSSDPSQWSVSLEYRATNDDPASGPIWSDWQRIVVGDVTARALQFRLRMAGDAAGTVERPYSMVTPVVEQLSVSIDMPDRTIGLDDLDVPAAGRRVVFDPPFRSVPAIVTNDQGMETGDVKTITDKAEDGFNIRFFDMYGVPVARTIDVVAKGYGSKFA